MVQAIKGRENTVFIQAPTGRDAELVSSTLERAGISTEVCNSIEELGDAISDGAGALLVAEEALTEFAVQTLVTKIDSQPVWSDIPIIVFSSSSRSAEAILHTLSNRVNATVVERPIRITMLLSAVRGALRARQRQYQTRDLLLQLEQSDKQKDLFLATLSHELRTPLNSILGWIQILNEHPSNREKVDHALDVIERNAKAQSEIIADILFVSRIVTGKLELRRQHVDIVDIVRGAGETVKPIVDNKMVEVELTVEPGLTTVNGDNERLQQIFLNLLSNAAKFTKRGGRIRVSVTPAQDSVEVAVSDDGRGISEDFLPYVFDRFRQADSTFTRRVGGLGLGLAIVKHLVDLHGGRVSAESEGRDRGATFRVRLPSVAQISEEASTINTYEPITPSANGLAGLRVLLVEDDRDSREMLSIYLQTHGIEVTTADSAARALEHLEKTKPQLLISDVGLPERDGYDLIREIRQRPLENGGGTPAIALTGYASLQDRHKALLAGYQEHLSKPVDVDELIHVVRDVIGVKKHHANR